ncbi:putative transposase [Palleronia aestuarii]|uniref:Putative transposase n=1 Tax=Palleronia aestuarii TaxID=568105 RepID=A0A2W7MYW4_9RHOB|nr:hypothetical protein [Palleronia aestuarii]PZX09804.1 putative transposase [Palleronia aestuarii]
MVDDLSRESLTSVADPSLSNLRVARDLNALIAQGSRMAMAVFDDVTALTFMVVMSWCHRTGVDWQYIAPGAPMRNTGLSKGPTGG